jgi:hypothetical protein
VIAACLCGIGLRKQEMHRHVRSEIIIDPKVEALRIANSNLMVASYEEIFQNLKKKGQKGSVGRFQPQADTWRTYG